MLKSLGFTDSDIVEFNKICIENPIGYTELLDIILTTNISVDEVEGYLKDLVSMGCI